MSSHPSKEKDIKKFSLTLATIGWGVALLVFPIDKTNIRMKVGYYKSGQVIQSLKRLFREEGIRGAYRGVTITPFTTLFGFFVNSYLYERLNYKWKHTTSLRSSAWFQLSPIINIYLAGLVSFSLGTPGVMLSTIIHSGTKSIKAAFQELFSKSKSTYWAVFKINYFSISTFLCVRQISYEHLTPIFRVRYGLSPQQTIWTTAALSTLIANFFFQPFQVFMAKITSNDSKGFMSVLRFLRASQIGLFRSLFVGFKSRLMSSCIFNGVYMPLYGLYKHKFDLHTYM